jgi:hypothetical protein
MRFLSVSGEFELFAEIRFSARVVEEIDGRRREGERTLLTWIHRMDWMKSTGWRWRVALNPVWEDFAGFFFEECGRFGLAYYGAGGHSGDLEWRVR